MCLIVCGLETCKPGVLGPSWTAGSQKEVEVAGEEERRKKSVCIAWEKENCLSKQKY
jgi:hypothetical protein